MAKFKLGWSLPMRYHRHFFGLQRRILRGIKDAVQME
jgi:hypothetical protein